MQTVSREHFRRAAADIASHGDNDTLPFDIDSRFVAAKQEELADIAYHLCTELAADGPENARKVIDSANIFSERLLAATGPSGFRIVTRIHPFWSIYLNGLAIAIAEVLEPVRSARVHSYRFSSQSDDLFDRDASWRAFRLATRDDSRGRDAVVVQTDISSFYEHVYHHRLQNRINDLFPDDKTVAPQVDRILNRLASGRSFGLPVGGQGARVLAEVLLAPVDQQLDELRLEWRRYVDDFVMVAASHADAYRGISVLSKALADYGLALNRSKTTVLSAKHFHDYVNTQLGMTGDEAEKLLEIDLHFDPYSDNPESDFEELKGVVDNLDVARLLSLELDKSQPDAFSVAQIGRTLRFHEPGVALQLCQTLLSPGNLHAFRASWSTLMRGIAVVRAEERLQPIHESLDRLIDAVPLHSSHLLTAEASCLHYLRTLRFVRTDARAQYVLGVYVQTSSPTVRRACLDCWRQWKDRASFTRERNQWSTLGPEEQRMLWYSAKDFGDEGEHFRAQVRRNVQNLWALGIERNGKPSFASVFAGWDGA